MANTFLTPSIIAKEALLVLENNLVAAQLFHRGHATEFTGAKVGDSISVRTPATFTAAEFTTTTSAQNATESSVTVTLEKHFDVTFAVTSKDYTLNLEEFSQQLIQPAAVAIAQAIDAYALGKYKAIYAQVGTAADPPDSLADLAAVDRQLNEAKVPLARRFAIVNPEAKADMLGISAVVQAEQRGDNGTALRDASLGRVMGIDWYMSQNVQAHTAGTFQAGSPVVNGAVSADATTMAVDGGSGTETILEGDIFTVAGATGEYVCTADATASSGAIASLSFTPGAPTGGFADDAAITIAASHDANIAGHPNGLTLAIVPLELPQGAAKAWYIGDRGLGLRVVADYSASTKSDTISIDVLCGAKVQQPALLTRILG